MFGFARSSSFEFGICNDFELKDSRFEVNQYTNRVKEKITFEYSERKNTSKYGRPGYRGNENGEVCQHPDYSDSYYKWNSFFEKWEDVSDKVCNDTIHSRSNGFMNNAAFESVWGNNPSGEDAFSTNRHRNGGDLWGTPHIRKPLGGFKKIAANIMKSIYEFTLNLKSAIDHYLKLQEAFKVDNIEEIEAVILKDNQDVVEEPMVKIMIEKVNDWSFFNNNGHVDQSGSLTRKDTSVYVKDVNRVNELVKFRNKLKKEDAYDKFKKNE